MKPKRSLGAYIALIAVSFMSLFAFGASAQGRNAAKPKAGAVMTDGATYVGASPEIKTPLFTTQADAPGIYTVYQAQTYCSELKADGHDDWHVPYKGELNTMFKNRAAVGGFDASGTPYMALPLLHHRGLILSAQSQRFSDGHQGEGFQGDKMALRCVR